MILKQAGLGEIEETWPCAGIQTGQFVCLQADQNLLRISRSSSRGGGGGGLGACSPKNFWKNGAKSCYFMHSGGLKQSDRSMIRFNTKKAESP